MPPTKKTASAAPRRSPHEDEKRDRVRQVTGRGDDLGGSPGDEHDPPPALVGPATGKRPQEERRDAEGADHKPDGEVVAAQRACGEPRRGGQEHAARDEEGEDRG
jgi:hypothetical protein